MSRTLTVGMLTYDDFDGVYFTIQSLRLHHRDVMHKVKFVVVDNNPKSAHGEAVDKLSKWVTEPIKYVPSEGKKSTSLRNLVFDHAETENVVCLDCHVLLEAGSLASLASYMESNPEGNLIQGPLLMDNLKDIQTHFDPVWRSGMFGIWGKDDRGFGSEAFDIPSMGLGAFACRKDSWLRFSDKFRGFGGEEGYIHEKFRAAGRRTLCLPAFKWLHRFARPSGVPYPLKWEDRIFNYFVGFQELGMDTSPIEEHFCSFISPQMVAKVKQEAQAAS